MFRPEVVLGAVFLSGMGVARSNDSERGFMARALRLARMGAGSVSPNPMVGAVVVRNDRIVGEGFHRQRGKPHAEALAIAEAGRRAEGADLYVNLEPCCHHGYTPPCTDAILEAGIRRVWLSIQDPNPRVDGRGIRLLRRHGIEVHTGLLAAEASRLNESYLAYMRTGRPFVILKLAATLDGKIATASGESRWISSVGSRRLAHRLRHEVDAILVGAGTVLADNPDLTVRMGIRRPRHPVRIVLDTRLRTPPDARVLDTSSGARTVVACGRRYSPKRAEALRSRGAEIWPFPVDASGRVRLASVVGRLGREGITSLLVEGGRMVAASVLKAGLADKLVMVISPKVLGGDALDAVGDLGVRHLSRAVTLEGVRSRRLGVDVVIEGYPTSRKGGAHVHRSG